MKPLDLIGQRFGKLVVVERSSKNAGGHFKWKCLCDCGKTTVCNGDNLKRNVSKSCGCLRAERCVNWAKPEGEASFNEVYYTYIGRAKKYSREFALTEEDFRKLTKENCHYCGTKPQQVSHPKGCNGSYIYNGIDRVDSEIGYILSNCVSCCGSCNKAKGSMSYSEFLNWINRLITFRGQ